MKEFFWMCSGASIPLLKRCPTESSKYAGIGAAIFFTGLLAVISSGYALYSVFDSIVYAFLFGLVWGLMIFNLDRFIVLSMRKSDKKHGELLQAIPRFILAILIALVISKPLEIKIFEKEIASELAIMGQEILKEQEESTRSRYVSALDSMQQEITELKEEIAAKEITRNTLFKIAQEEADGTGGTKKRNAGPIYRIKEKDAKRVQQELELLRERNNETIVKIETSISGMQERERQDFQLINDPNLNGLSFKLTALDRLGVKYPTIFLANLFIVFLFIAIEIAPILSKLISPIGPYDHLLEVKEHFYSNYKKEKIAKSNIALEKSLA